MVVSELQFAVSLMEGGHYEEAITAMDQMLGQLRTYFFAQEKLTEAESKISRQEAWPATATVEAFLGPRCVPVAHRSTENKAHATEYPVYERAMILRVVNDDSAWTNEVNVAVITSVVLYNKGLIFHMLGQGHGAGHHVELYNTRAKALYEKALHLINTCSSAVEQNFWIKSVLLTNIGQICSYLCDRPGEQACLAHIDHLLAHRNIQANSGHDETEIYMNVVFLLGVHRPSPAA